MFCGMLSTVIHFEQPSFSSQDGEVSNRMLKSVLCAVSQHMPLEAIQLEVPEADWEAFKVNMKFPSFT
jgi:hypothetical protein